MTFTTFVRPLALALFVAGILDAAEVRPNMLLLDGAFAGDTVLAVGERGTILRSTDQALTWQAAKTGTAATLTGVSSGPGSPKAWAVGHDALILFSNDAGATWTKQWQGENLQDSFLDVLALDGERVIAVGAYGLYLSSLDGGRTWQRRKIIDGDFHFNRIARGPTGTLYLAGERGTLLRSRDQGINWERIESPYDGSFYGLLPLSARALVACGLQGRIFRSDDDGATWTPVPNQARALIATAVVAEGGALLFAGQARAWLISRDGGQTVLPWASPLTGAVAELVSLPGGRVLALGEAGATLLPRP
ncbi:MAG: glycosyl hydrolase, repeat [Verrucomicrobia bacterium]|nr:glycosyl hydrolase, repeat [Verrucomicrobiota bacterium]